MIRRRTVFVLGAGASIPYGFPSGEDLLQEARRLSPKEIHEHLCIESTDPIQPLYDALVRTHDASLDSILDLRTDLRDAGKRLIASLLLQREFNSTKHYPNRSDDWITLLFGELTAGTRSLDEFVENQVVFVTFNYDRLLEHRILGALMCHYDPNERACVDAMQKIKIIHLHGQLARLPGFDDPNHVIPFGPSPGLRQEFCENINRAIHRILVVHEAQPQTIEFRLARSELNAAEKIVFLGFGYGETNLRRLEIESWSKSASIFGTAYGLTEKQIYYDVQQRFRLANNRTILLGQVDHGTREFFENNLEIFRA